MEVISYPVEGRTAYFHSDKIYYHGYYPEYVRIAAELGPAAQVCEVGVYRGESLRMWQSLFPLGKVTGVDNDPRARWPLGTRKVVKSQDDAELAELGPFDLIVDDASHYAELTKKTFEILWPRVSPGGFYVVEDWWVGLGTPGQNYMAGMLEVVQDFLRLLEWPDSECESVLYKYGMAIVKRRA